MRSSRGTLLQIGLAESEDHPLYNHIYLHNHFPTLIQFDSLPKTLACLLLAYVMGLRPMRVTNPYHNLLPPGGKVRYQPQN
jgi:hypothetical protein